MARAKRTQQHSAPQPTTLRTLADVVRAARELYETGTPNVDERLKLLRVLWRVESERPWVVDELERLAGHGKIESRIRALGFALDCLPEEEKPKSLGESVLEEMMRQADA